ncbi:hypothetical protein G7Y89_g11671 [Cudoniella acicularis]|uniref:Uncharacterized protein n=1 Tax=Cudoniella acicularis TaxID=354080 RepID=A0A8H4VXN1_9HELO|nr:hypothetical protein G7Y89_g11671 [Cudoniella acicularis]
MPGGHKARASRAARARHLTPPPELLHEGPEQVKTPHRAGVLYAKLYAQELSIEISTETIRKVTGVARRIQGRILASKRVRTRHNAVDKGPDPRGRKPLLSRSETATIAAYLNDPSTSLDDKGKPWLDIAEDAGIELRTECTRTVRRACKRDEGIINAICEEEKELT